MLKNRYFEAKWNVAPRVKTLITTKLGGRGDNDYGEFNLAHHVGDRESNVIHNRQILDLSLPSSPHWLNQVHSNLVLNLDNCPSTHAVATYDAQFTRKPDTVCAIMTADCLPILLTDIYANFVAAVHAGWRGLHTDIIANTLNAVNLPNKNLIAYIGPAICSKHYEVGQEILDLFIHKDPHNSQFFTPQKTGKFECDLVAIAKHQLQQLGVLPQQIYLSNSCTYCKHELFYSFRKKNKTGRFASLIWLDHE